MTHRKDLRVVIAGGGRVGFRTAHYLDDLGHESVIIERNPDRSAWLSDEYIATVIRGDGLRPSTLEQAGLDRTDVIAALTGETGQNFGICMSATRINPDLRTVMRVDDPDDADEFETVVDSVVFPEHEGAKIAADEIVGSAVRTLGGATGEIEIMNVLVDEDAPAAGMRLDQVSLPEGSLVVSDYDGNRIARADSVLEPGEHVVIAVEPSVADEVMRLLRG